MGRYGIEAEFYGIDPWDAATMLNKAGVPTEREDYNHRTRDHWKLVDDSSVTGEGNELVSPILTTGLTTGATQTKRAMDTLRDNGGRIDRSCGLHVHHDASRMTMANVVELIGLYGLYQDVINTLLPPSRRGHGSNEYTRPLTANDWREAKSNEKWVRDRGDEPKTLPAQNMPMWGGRYQAINLYSLEAHGTLEFRQHSGTLNPTKANWWVKLTNGLVTRARIGVPRIEGILQAFDHSWADARADQTLAGLCRMVGMSPEGKAYFEQRQLDLEAAQSLSQHEPSPDPEDKASEEYETGYARVDHCGNCGEHYDNCECCGECGGYGGDCTCCRNCGSPRPYVCGCCSECGWGNNTHATWCDLREPEPEGE